jgi:hypothetical protein
VELESKVKELEENNVRNATVKDLLPFTKRLVQILEKENFASGNFGNLSTE